MWLLSLVFAVVFAAFVYYALSRLESGESSQPISVPPVALAAIFVLAAVGGLVLLDTSETPPSLVPDSVASSTPSNPTTDAPAQQSTPTHAVTATPTPTEPAASSPQPTSTARSTTPPDEETIVHVADGDTITVRRADGQLKTYALAGVDAPETTANDPKAFAGVLTGSRGRACLADFGRRATVFVRTRYLDRSVELSTVSAGAGERAYVSVGNTSLNRRLVARGYARADGDFAKLETRAQVGSLGLWSCRSVTYTPTDDSGIAVTKIHPNPAGDDAATLDGEYFVLTNVGTDPVELGNWYVVVDDRHYLFLESETLLPGADVAVHVGRGRDTSTHQYLGSNAPVLDNDHGVLVLRDGNNVRNVTVSY